MAKLDPDSPSSLHNQRAQNNLIELNPQYKGHSNDFLWRQHHHHQQQQHQQHQYPIFLDTPTEPQLPIAQQLSHYFRRLQMQNPSIAITFFLSILAFVAWQVPRAELFLQQHFLCRRSNLAAGRAHALVLASISHKGLYHLLVNCMTLLTLGPAVQQAIAPRPLWPLLFGASLSGSVIYLIMNSFLHRQRYSRGCLGLSAVTLGLMAFWARLYPERTLGFFLGPIPVRMNAKKALYAMLTLSFVATIFPMSTGRDSIAHSAHLGGLLFGYLYYEWWFFQRRRSQRQTKWKVSSY